MVRFSAEMSPLPPAPVDRSPCMSTAFALGLMPATAFSAKTVRNRYRLIRLLLSVPAPRISSNVRRAAKAA